MMEAELVALDGVKFLSLGRSRKDLSKIDDVIKEVVLGKLLNVETQPPASLPPPVAAANVETIPSSSSTVPLIPFVASVQYSVLEEEADMIYGLIQSVTRRMGLAVDKDDIRSSVQPLPEYISSWKTETVQADKLAEFSSFRKAIMANLPTVQKEMEDDDDSLDNWDTMISLRKSGEKIPKRRVLKGRKTQ